jgi:hypothetical protein
MTEIGKRKVGKERMGMRSAWNRGRCLKLGTKRPDSSVPVNLRSRRHAKTAAKMYVLRRVARRRDFEKDTNWR